MSLEKLLTGKPKVFVILVLSLAFSVMAVIFFRLPYITYTGEKISLSPLEIDMYDLNFADEPVPIDPLVNPRGREKLEKELLVTHLSLYQILLHHRYAYSMFPSIETYFHEIGIPDDFKYLAVAESGLRDDVVSPAGAAGVWQLMPDTARRYGLRVDSEIDERFDFERSTRAAGAYLLHLKSIFPNWTLVAAAYNRGETGLQKDQDANVGAKNSYYNLVLNKETGEYVYRIVAIKYLMQNRWKLFSPELLGNVFEKPQTKVIPVSGPQLDLRHWCFENDVSYQELRELNPWIMGYTLPGGVWDVRLFVR